MTLMNPSYAMSSSRFVSRANKTRFFAYFCFILVLCAVVYIFHGTQSQLQEAIKESDYCSHKVESLSVKLQRANFHSAEIEKVLDNERETYQRTLRELNASFSKDRTDLNGKITDLDRRFDELNQKYLALQVKYDEATDGSNAVRKELMDQKEENSKLSSKLSSAHYECSKLTNEKTREISDLKEQLAACQKSPTKPGDVNEVPATGGHEKQVGNGPITPGVNPQAVDSAADHEEIMKQNLKSSTTTLSSANKANNAGVLPIPEPNDEVNNMKPMDEALNVKGRAKSLEDEPNPNIDAPEEDNVIPDERDNADKKYSFDLENSRQQMEKANGIHPNQPNMVLPAPPDSSRKHVAVKNFIPSAADGEKDVVENSKQIKNEYKGGEYDKEPAEDEGEENDEPEYIDDTKQGAKQVKAPPIELNNDQVAPKENVVGDSVIVQPK